MERNGMMPDPWQRDVLRAWPCMQLVCWSRQTGKTTCFGALANFIAMNRPGALVLIGSGNHDKAKELLAKSRMLHEPYEREYPLISETSERRKYANGSEIRAIPARLLSARGPTATVVILDESSCVDDDFFTTIFPTMARTRGSLVALSTPPPEPRGWWYEQWTQGGQYPGREALAVSDHWHRSFVTVDESNHATPEHLAQAKLILSPEDYAREYECRFPSQNAGALGERAIPRDAIDRFFAGMDDEAPEARW